MCLSGVGLAGVAFLVGPSGEVDLIGGLVILAGSLSWSVGSLYAPRAGLPAGPVVSAAMQMLAASALLAVAGSFAGELSAVRAPSAESVGALAYLVVVGSIVAFTPYGWLLRSAPGRRGRARGGVPGRGRVRPDAPRGRGDRRRRHGDPDPEHRTDPRQPEAAA